MLTSIRRLISYPNPVTRLDPADIALYVKNLVDALEVDVIYGQGTFATRPVSTVGSPGIAGRIYVATDLTPHGIYYDYGTGWDSLTGTPSPAFDVLANRGSAAAAGAGKVYYATDQDSFCVSDGSTWIRLNDKPGDVIWTEENTARTGYIICTGQAWPSTTGIYADLFAKWGALHPTTLPDYQGREFVAKGTHADINTIAFNDGISTVANRRPKHKTSIAETAHFHTSDNGQNAGGGGGAKPLYNADATGNSLTSATSSVSTGITAGPQTGAEPIDSGAYIVLQPQVKL